MNKKILKIKFSRIAICLIMASALLLGGCSTPGGQKQHLSSSSPSEQKPDETQSQDENSSGQQGTQNENPSGQQDAQKESSSGQQDAPGQNSDSQNPSAEEDFDFNQNLALKTPEPAAGASPRILFVGNSHTFTNNLPGIFSELSAAMGHQSEVQEITEGAYTLTKFADPADEMGSVLNQKLTEETWDFVILQENTNDAVITPEETMLPAARTLDEKIHAAGAQTCMLMTWSPKEGAGILSLNNVQTLLSQNLMNVSKELDSLLIPGGVAFMRCMEQSPQIELWGEDGMHPSLEGSYLAACTAYAVIFQESPEGCSYTADLDAETASQLQSLAAGFLDR